MAKGAEKKWVFDIFIEGSSNKKIPVKNIRPVSGNITWFVSFECESRQLKE